MTTGFESQIHERVERAVTSPAYRNYLTVRRAVYAMMDEWNRVDPAGGPSGYWKEEIEGFLYLLDASPLVVDTLREQCYHITGIKSYEYRSHHTHMAGRFKAKYDALKAIDTWGLFVPEAEPLSGFGFDIGVGRVNIDTLKFYEVLIGLARSGALSKFSKSGGERRTVVEIGSGWGGFAYQFKTLYPNTTYVCVDLPMTMLFSGTYLRTLFPNAKVLSFGEPDFDRKIADIKSYDFVFVPHFYFPKLTSLPIDLAVNMVSFQEMTTGQVDGYVRQLAKMGVKQLYSMNRDRSKHNKELSTVSEILKSHYKVELVPVLDAQYTQLEPPKAPPGKELHVLDYRHYYATL